MSKLNFKNLKGGKYMGSGTFGCVLTPNIKCHNKADFKDVNIENKKLISKLSTYKYYDSDSLETVYDEIEVGKRIFKIDKECLYLCPIIHHCRIKDLNDVNTREDIKMKNIEDMNDVDLEYKKEGHEKKCLFNINEEFIAINLISYKAGIDLHAFFKGDFKKEKTLFKKELKKIITDLLIGLKMLHHNHITHKDIKLNNICISFDNNIPLIKYIDFGLSEDLDDLDQTTSNIINSGTPAYMSPDFIVLIEMKKKKFKSLANNKKNHINIINKLYNSIKSNLSTFTNKGLNKTFLKGNLDTPQINFYINEKDNNNYFITKKEISELFIFILNIYKNNELINYYFRPINGLNSKFDIFSLGLIMFELKKKMNIKDILLVNLLKNMLEINSINRFSIDDCLNHIYVNKE